MEIGAEQLGHEVATILSAACAKVRGEDTYMSSSGEMKMSLRLII